MRCPRCGNENPTTNRFCGMCGTSLLQAPSPAQSVPPAKPPGVASVAGTVAGSTPAAAPAAGKVSSVTASAPPAPSAIPTPPDPAAPPAPGPAAAGEESPIMSGPIISGPSFLGLNQPAPAPRRRNPLSIDPHAGPSSSNLDYLLEDDEEEHKSGAGWKFVLMLIALVLAAGFGYLRWKGQPPPWTGSSANKPSAAAQNSGGADANSPALSSPAASPAASAAQPAAGVSPTATDSAGASPSSVSPSSAGPASASSAPATSTPVAPAASPAAGNAPASPGANASGGGGAGSAPAQPSASSTAPAATTGPKPAPVIKPRAAAPPADPVAEAQKYIYGKRVPQDCDRGLRILKPAADQANAKAMIEMGALYSAGLCTPRDLPTAYRWFALALRKDPDNQALQADLQKLWGEMTQPERQLAIKLSQ